MPPEPARRSITAEVARQFRGTPAERVLSALRAADLEIRLFRANLPPETAEDVVRREIRKKKHAGRNPSGCLDEP